MKLGRRLKVKDPVLQAINQRYEQLSEKGYRMLKSWKQENGCTATYRVLYDALIHELMQRQDLADKYC